MEMIQAVLVYLSLGFAVFFLAKKYILPKGFLGLKKESKGSCGQDNCGCH